MKASGGDIGEEGERKKRKRLTHLHMEPTGRASFG
jgi:hypothetical protein